MAKKKIIISREQLKKLDEANEPTIVIPFNGNTPQQANAAYQNARGQIDYAESHSQNGDVRVSLQGDNADENKPTQSAVVDPNNKNITQQIDPTLFNANPSVEIQDKEATYEGKRFTKKQLEETRLNNIKKNGTVYTKKSLRESIFSPALSAVEWGDGLKKYINEFITNINNDQELQNYLMRPGEFSACLHEVMQTAQQLLTDLDELSNARP